jgi:hypothetical protein
VAKVLGGEATYGIDDFSQFDPEMKNLSIVEGHIQRLGVENVLKLSTYKAGKSRFPDYESTIQADR